MVCNDASFSSSNLNLKPAAKFIRKSFSCFIEVFPLVFSWIDDSSNAGNVRLQHRGWVRDRVWFQILYSQLELWIIDQISLVSNDKARYSFLDSFCYKKEIEREFSEVTKSKIYSITNCSALFFDFQSLFC